MDERRHLILIKGENKTWQIKWCHYDPQNRRYQVTFDNNKTYAYGYNSVDWRKDPEVLNPVLYQITAAGNTLNNIQAIFAFRGHEEWWHIAFERRRRTNLSQK